MSTEGQAQAQAQQTTETGEQTSLLEQAITATRQTERSRAEELLKTLTEEALKGTVRFDKNLTRTITDAVAAIDQVLSKQLAAIMHDPGFQKLEGTWRGLHYLVMNSETGKDLKIRVLNAPKREMAKDLEKAVEFDQSQLFKKLYENEFGTPGGEPYGTLIGDYEFSNHPDDVEMLAKISQVSAAAFCPFGSATDPKLFGFGQWTELSRPRDLTKIFDSVEYAKWNSFRDSEDSRFVTLTMPRTLARMPYGAATKPIEEFSYEEFEPGSDGAGQQADNTDFCWMNSAYVMGARMTNAFAQYGFCVAIRGAEGGGKVEGLPAYTFTSDDGDPSMQCPTEIAITDRREKEMSDLGFLPLCHYKDTDYAVFFGAQSTQRPKKYDRPEATANAAISARMPYLMATSRFAHFLKVIARDKIGSFMEVEDCERWLNRWISNYVNASQGASAEMKAKYPLREAKVQVKEVPGAPGSYHAVAHLRPWLQMEELTTSLRMVARIPKMG